MEPAIAGMSSDLIYALSVIAYVPLGIMLTAVSVVSLQTRAFPVWLVWLSSVVAAANMFMSLGIVAESGPLVPGDLPTNALYTLIWYGYWE
ncbi:MAG: hypothetical protein DRP87_19430 [Spirochaetes bacterium]|nr:MAG: hypothetical protein DRP87_19430 [Spirochaetota bacterium]